MSLRSRFRNWRHPTPNIEIVSPLTPAECHQRLTGKERARWYGDDVLKPLRLPGSISTRHLSMRLRSSYAFGSIDRTETGTLVRLSATHGMRGRRPIIEDSLVVAGAAVPFVAYDLLYGGDVFGFLFFPALLLAAMWRRELGLTWPAFPGNVNELAQTLAGHLEGTVEFRKESSPIEDSTRARENDEPRKESCFRE